MTPPPSPSIEYHHNHHHHHHHYYYYYYYSYSYYYYYPTSDQPYRSWSLLVFWACHRPLLIHPTDHHGSG